MGHHDALLQVRAGLCDRIDALATGLPTLSTLNLCDQVDDIRRVAQAHGFVPLARLAGALESAMANGERNARARAYLELMRDAACCERLDDEAGTAFLAAASVRFAG